MLEAKIIVSEGSLIDKEISELEKEATTHAVKDWDKAIACLEQVKILKKKAGFTYSFKSYLRLPDYLQQAGRMEDALIEFEELISETPDRVFASIIDKKEYSLELKKEIQKQQEYQQLSEIYKKMALTYKREKQEYQQEYYNDLHEDFEEKSEELAYSIDRELNLIWQAKQEKFDKKLNLKKENEERKDDTIKIKLFTRQEIRQLAINDAAEFNNLNFVSGSSAAFEKLSQRHAAYKQDLTKNFPPREKADFFRIMAEEVEVQSLITRNNLILFNIKNGVAFDYQTELNEINESRNRILQNLAIEDQQELLDYLLLEAQSANKSANEMQNKFNKDFQPVINKIIGLQVFTFIIVFIIVFFIIIKLLA